MEDARARRCDFEVKRPGEAPEKPAKSEAIRALDLAIAANHLPLHGAVLRQVDVERPLAGVELHARLMRGLRIGLARIEHGDRADVLVVEIENGEVALQGVGAGMELPGAEVMAVAAIDAAVVDELDVLQSGRA